MLGVNPERARALHPLQGLQQSGRGEDELQSFIRANAAEFLARQRGTRSGDDPEDLHKFRVATRRIRSLLRSTRGQLDDRVGGAAQGRAQVARLAARRGP